MVQIFTSSVSGLTAAAEAVCTVHKLFQSSRNEGAYPEFDLPAVRGHEVFYKRIAKKAGTGTDTTDHGCRWGPTKGSLTQAPFTEDNIVVYKKKVLVREESGR